MKTRLIIVLLFLCGAYAFGNTLAAVPTPPQTTHILEEAETIYLGNLARQANGIPPLRWNRELTNAARWYSWDSVENRPDGFCGHDDTNGQWPSDRARIFGYLGFAGAENAFCGYVTPQQAIDGWMNSPGHRANLLDPNSREIGLGYYVREGDGRGYVTQDFGVDAVYPPVIIENEALQTSTPAVNLYIYDRTGGGGFTGLSPATSMKVSNDPCFSEAVWEPYTANKSWMLENEEGWRTVYVKTQDSIGRTSTVSDTIYLGTTLPADELSLTQAAGTQSHVKLYGLEGDLPNVQMSLGWFADDTNSTFNLWWGNGQSMSDPDALGESAFVLQPGNGESFAWVYTTEFIKNTPFVAYVRLKVNDNTSAGEVARFSVSGGGTDYGPLSLAGTDFDAPNQYQEFALPFSFHDTEDVFLIFNFWRSGEADVSVDGVSIFTAPVPVTSPLTWTVPGSNYRGQGVWARFTDGAGQFSAFSEAQTHPTGFTLAPTTLFFMAQANGPTPIPQTANVTLTCGQGSWQATSETAWLQIETQAGTGSIRIWPDPTGLSTGTYTGTVTLTVPGDPTITPVQLNVTLWVVDEIHSIYLPDIQN